MFAPPYSPNKKFSNSKISLKELRKTSTTQNKYCLRCQMKSFDSKQPNKKPLRINPLILTTSFKSLPNFISSNSVLSQQNLKNTQNNKKKFEPFSTFGKTDSKTFLMSLKEGKITKKSLSLQRFSKQVKKDHQILYKKIIYSTTNINEKFLAKKSGKRSFEKKNIYKLYSSLKEEYEKLKAELDTKNLGLHSKNQQNSYSLKQDDTKNLNVKEQKIDRNEVVSHCYQIKTEWGKSSKNKASKQQDSQTSIEGQENFEKQNCEANSENYAKSLVQIQKQKEFYRQQCLGLEQELQSVYTMVMQLKKQIQVLNQKNEKTSHQCFLVDNRTNFLQISPIYHQIEFKNGSEIKSSDFETTSFQNANNFSQTMEKSDTKFMISKLPTEETIFESTSIILEDNKRQNQNLFKKIPESRQYEERGIQHGELRQTKNTKNDQFENKISEPVQRYAEKQDNDSLKDFQKINKRNPYESETTLISSSAVSSFTSSRLCMPEVYQSRFCQSSLSSQNHPVQVTSYKSQHMLKPIEYVQIKPPSSTISVNRYHSYCKKNCEINQCKCLIEMMTVSSNCNT